MPRAIIDKLVIYPPHPAFGIENDNRALYGSIDGVPIVVALPLELPLTRPKIKAYLLSKLPEIRAVYEVNLTMQPIHNLEIAQEFDFQWPDA